MSVSLTEAKNYLRVDSSDDDGFIQILIQTAEKLIMDISRLPKDSIMEQKSIVEIAELLIAEIVRGIMMFIIASWFAVVIYKQRKR